MSFKLINAQDVLDVVKGANDWGSEFDSLLEDRFIPTVTEMFAQYCNRPDFDLTARTQYFSPHCKQQKLFLSSAPISTNPAISLWHSGDIPRVYGDDELLVEGQDYFVNYDQGIIDRYFGWWAEGPNTVKVTCTGGYLTANYTGCPADLKWAAIDQVSVLFSERGNAPFASRSLDGSSQVFVTPAVLPTRIKIVLDKYKIRNVASA